MPAGYDAEVAELFRDLRAASNLTETDLAQRIATPIEVVQALEQGAIYALPPWPETCRVVNAYGTLLNLDTRPLLRRIYAQLEAGIVELRPKTTPDVPVMAPQSSDGRGGDAARAPQPPAMPPPPAWPNGHGAAHPQAPQPRAPQTPQHNAWPGAEQQYPQNPPNYAPQPQSPAWPNGPQAPQPQPQAYRPEAQPSYTPEPAAAPPPPLEDASFPGEAAVEPNEKKPALLKWGIGALVAAVVLVGLWMALGGSSSDTGSSSGFNTSDPVLDPDDPRSRKADRLPNNF